MEVEEGLPEPELLAEGEPEEELARDPRALTEGLTALLEAVGLTEGVTVGLPLPVGVPLGLLVGDSEEVPDPEEL